MNCKAVCLQIEDADVSWQPDRMVRQHLESCEKCRAFHEERSKLRQLVNSLGMVQAPADFEFRLRARLAEGKNVRQPALWFGRATFGWPSAVVAALVLIVGAVVVLRTSNRDLIHDKAMVPQAPRPEPIVAAPGSKTIEQGSNPVVATASSLSGSPKPTTESRRQRASMRRPRTTTREYSSLAAKVVKPEDTLASADPVFTIYTSDQPMSVSLDDGSGVRRTISLPRFSFGSQRAFATEQTSMVKTSAKGVW